MMVNDKKSAQQWINSWQEKWGRKSFRNYLTIAIESARNSIVYHEHYSCPKEAKDHRECLKVLCKAMKEHYPSPYAPEPLDSSLNVV